MPSPCTSRRFFGRDFASVTAVIKVLLILLNLGLVASCGIAKDAVDYYNRGLTKEDKGDMEGAIADYSRAIDLDPKYTDAYNNRGNAKHENGDMDGAIADYSRAIELNPKDGDLYYNRGIVKHDKGDLVGAIADYDRAIELDPKDGDKYNNRGLVKTEKGDADGAIADYNHAIELNPKDPLYFSNRGDADVIGRKWKAALNDYNQSCVLSKKHQGHTHVYIWLVRARLGETEAASQELGTYIDSRWDAAPDGWIASVAGHLTGKVPEADLFAAAKSTDDEKERRRFCEAWYFTGMKKLFGGDKTTAVNYFKRCLATGLKDAPEYQFAQSELKTLAQ